MLRFQGDFNPKKFELYNGTTNPVEDITNK